MGFEVFDCGLDGGEVRCIEGAWVWEFWGGKAGEGQEDEGACCSQVYWEREKGKFYSQINWFSFCGSRLSLWLHVSSLLTFPFLYGLWFWVFNWVPELAGNFTQYEMLFCSPGGLLLLKFWSTISFHAFYEISPYCSCGFCSANEFCFWLQIDENVQREIINHRSLRHPNIVRFKEVRN